MSHDLPKLEGTPKFQCGGNSSEDIHQERMLFLLHPFAKCDAFCTTFACFRRSGNTYKRKEKVRETAFATFVNFCIPFHA